MDLIYHEKTYSLFPLYVNSGDAMNKVLTVMSTGWKELDDVIQRVQPGDNIVWQVNDITDYHRVVQPYFILVQSTAHSSLTEQDKYLAAEMIGRVANLGKGREEKSVMLIGPGRWETSTPSLGGPVKYGDKNVSVMAEIAEMHDRLITDISLGTHFFNDQVELDIQYLENDLRKLGHDLNREFLAVTENRFSMLWNREPLFTCYA
jgi:hypothetical protein